MNATIPTPADIERAAMILAEKRVPGSTRPGGHYVLSEAWRMLIQRQARADLERAAAFSPLEPVRLLSKRSFDISL